MPTTMTEDEWRSKLAKGEMLVVPSIDGQWVDPVAVDNSDGTITRYATLTEAMDARSDRYFEMGLQRRLVVTTHQAMEPNAPDSVLLTCSWGWRSDPLDALSGTRQERAPNPFSESDIEWAKAEVDRLHTETGRTTTLYERHLSVNRVLYVRG